MKTIYKYQLEPGINIVSLHEDTKPLYAAGIDNNIFVWCLVETDNIQRIGSFRVCATGENLQNLQRDYSGTAILSDKTVWHVFY